jgi:hypothetical protein
MTEQNWDARHDFEIQEHNEVRRFLRVMLSSDFIVAVTDYYDHLDAIAFELANEQERPRHRSRYLERIDFLSQEVRFCFPERWFRQPDSPSGWGRLGRSLQLVRRSLEEANSLLVTLDGSPQSQDEYKMAYERAGAALQGAAVDLLLATEGLLSGIRGDVERSQTEET